MERKCNVVDFFEKYYLSEGQKSDEEWHRIYGFHSGNEIYDVVARDSEMFEQFIGKTFPYASFQVHKR